MKVYAFLSVAFFLSMVVLAQATSVGNFSVLSASGAVSPSALPILKGFVVSENDQRYPDQNGTVFSYPAIAQMKAYGANAVRIHNIRGSWLMPTKGAYNMTYIEAIMDSYVQAATDLQIYCILELGDWNWASYFLPANSGGGMPDWFFQGKYSTDTNNRAKSAWDFWDISNPKQSENRQWFVKWWQFIADRYKSNPWVIISIYNEPLNPGRQLITSKADSMRIAASYVSFMERVYDAIMLANFQGAVIVNCPFVWYLSDIPKIKRDIIWDFHLYVDGTSGIDTWKSMFMERYNLFYVQYQQPYVMLEFGIYPTSLYSQVDYKAILDEEVATMIQYNSLGWFWLEWGSLYGNHGSELTAEQSANVIAAIFPTTSSPPVLPPPPTEPYPPPNPNATELDNQTAPYTPPETGINPNPAAVSPSIDYVGFIIIGGMGSGLVFLMTRIRGKRSRHR